MSTRPMTTNRSGTLECGGTSRLALHHVRRKWEEGLRVANETDERGRMLAEGHS